jgi:mono/diheme cytochrome c family protein
MHQWKQVSYGLVLFGLSIFDCAAADSRAEAPTTAEATPAALAAGRKVYNQYCAGCHKSDGQGGGHGGEAGPKPPALNTGVWTHGSSDQEIFNVIKFGLPPKYYMIPWEGQISDEDIWNVVRYVRTFQSKP